MFISYIFRPDDLVEVSRYVGWIVRSNLSSLPTLFLRQGQKIFEITQIRDIFVSEEQETVQNQYRLFCRRRRVFLLARPKYLHNVGMHPLHIQTCYQVPIQMIQLQYLNMTWIVRWQEIVVLTHHNGSWKIVTDLISQGALSATGCPGNADNEPLLHLCITRRISKIFKSKWCRLRNRYLLSHVSYHVGLYMCCVSWW